ncbi:SixA phosphatase family protein [Roseobacter sp. HKCCA0434]|uniref:SixA phosphatase family protein n=1 Tax=Roseobacter sp. HKCCA0434 TaxID=3079297 RepID=UPI002905EB63|nr:histidine phosphatase family protein [Roseobacter sp. HKCCA0434]
MKRILVIRHAKSSWSDPDQPDIERPLNQRGRLSAPLMAAQILEWDVVPDAVWVSPSRRTQETWERMRPVLGAGKAKVHDAIYMGDPAALRDVLRETKGAETVAIVGHQPGVSALVRKLSDGKIGTSCARAFSSYPTAAVSLLQADIADWADLDWKSCDFRQFAVPKDLV